MNETLIINGNRLFAPVRVGQLAGYAHLDTGARYSAVVEPYAEGFPQAGSREYRGALDKATTTRVRLGELSFLGKTRRDAIVDVQPGSVGGLDALPFEVVMALGCDTLLQSPLHLDLVKREIGFLEEGDVAPATGVRIDADFSFFDMPFFNLTAGTRPLRALFDTGAGLSVLNRRLLAELEGEIAEGEPLEVEDATGAKHVIPTFRCRTLHAGDAAFDGCRTLAIDLSHTEQEIGVQIDFVFGMNAMMGKEWIVDRHDQSIKMK